MEFKTLFFSFNKNKVTNYHHCRRSHKSQVKYGKNTANEGNFWTDLRDDSTEVQNRFKGDKTH